MNARNSEIVRTTEAAQMLGVHLATLYRWGDKNPSFPKRIKLGSGKGGASGYLRSEILNWLEKRKTV